MLHASSPDKSENCTLDLNFRPTVSYSHVIRHKKGDLSGSPLVFLFEPLQDKAAQVFVVYQRIEVRINVLGINAVGLTLLF